MTVAGGFEYDYGTVDQYAPNSMTYPASFVEYTEEDGLDDVDGVIERTTRDAFVSFRVIAAGGSSAEEVANDIDADFTKLFADNFDTYRGLGLMEYAYQGRSIKYRLVDAYPVEVILNYRFKYRFQKASPFST